VELHHCSFKWEIILARSLRVRNRGGGSGCPFRSVSG
jgi:hypothetical protein